MPSSDRLQAADKVWILLILSFSSIVPEFCSPGRPERFDSDYRLR